MASGAESGRSGSRRGQILVRALLLVADGHLLRVLLWPVLSVCGPRGIKPSSVSSSSSSGTSHPIWLGSHSETSFTLNYVFTGPISHTVTLGIRASAQDFGGDTIPSSLYIQHICLHLCMFTQGAHDAGMQCINTHTETHVPICMHNHYIEMII